MYVFIARTSLSAAPSTLDVGGRSPRFLNPFVRILIGVLPEKHEGHVAVHVGLGQHGSGCLNQDVVFGQARALRRYVHVGNATAGCFHVGLLEGQVLRRETQPRHRGGIIGPQGRDVLDCLCEYGDRNVGKIDGLVGVLRREGHVVAGGERAVKRIGISFSRRQAVRVYGQGGKQKRLVDANLRPAVSVSACENTDRII